MIDWIKENVAAVLIGVGVVIIGVLISLFVITHDEPGTVMNKQWSRTISIQKYDWVHHSKESNYAPTGAINIKRWTETENYTTTSTTGSGENKKTKTEYHTRFVDHISYDVQEWTYSRDVKSEGVHPQLPEWPAYVLGIQPLEREGGRTEQYTVVVRVKDRDKTFHPEFAQYTDMSIDRKYNCSINGFGSVVRINFN